MDLFFYDEFPLQTEYWGVQSVLEGSSIPSLRGSDTQIPYSDGKRHEKKRFDSRPFILAMWVIGDEEQSLAESTDKLKRLFGRLGQRTLRRVMANDEERYAQAEVHSVDSFDVEGYEFSRFTVEFTLADPLFYSRNKVILEQIYELEESNWFFMNEGTAHSTDLVISLHGPLENPKVFNRYNNIWFQYIGVIAEGETARIETEYFTCKIGESNRTSSIVHGGDANWLTLEAGANELQLTSDITGGSIAIEYYPTYF